MLASACEKIRWPSLSDDAAVVLMCMPGYDRLADSNVAISSIEAQWQFSHLRKRKAWSTIQSGKGIFTDEMAPSRRCDSSCILESFSCTAPGPRPWMPLMLIVDRLSNVHHPAGPIKLQIPQILWRDGDLMRPCCNSGTATFLGSILILMIGPALLCMWDITFCKPISLCKNSRSRCLVDGSSWKSSLVCRRPSCNP